MTAGTNMIFPKLNGVLSFQRGIILTDGLMFNILENGGRPPVKVIRHGIRGISNKENAISPSNIQRTESAKTSPDAVGIAVEYYIRMVPVAETIFNCALEQTGWRKTFDDFMAFHAQDKTVLTELSHRYARNVLSGRWLWRNQFLSEDISVTVSASVKAGTDFSEVCSAQCATIDQHSFSDYTDAEKKLASLFLACFLGEVSYNFKVEGRIMFGFKGCLEVFPSQNFVTGKPKGFARPLYKVNPISRRDLQRLSPKNTESAGEFFGDTITMGDAALRDQKIGNALRTIDTWWSTDETAAFPIAVEPNGASLSTNDYKRSSKSKNTWVSYLCSMANLHSDSPAAHFLMAMFIRGGVHGDKD